MLLVLIFRLPAGTHGYWRMVCPTGKIFQVPLCTANVFGLLVMLFWRYPACHDSCVFGEAILMLLNEGLVLLLESLLTLQTAGCIGRQRLPFGGHLAHKLWDGAIYTFLFSPAFTSHLRPHLDALGISNKAHWLQDLYLNPYLRSSLDSSPEITLPKGANRNLSQQAPSLDVLQEPLTLNPAALREGALVPFWLLVRTWGLGLGFFSSRVHPGTAPLLPRSGNCPLPFWVAPLFCRVPLRSSFLSPPRAPPASRLVPGAMAPSCPVWLLLTTMALWCFTGHPPGLTPAPSGA